MRLSIVAAVLAFAPAAVAAAPHHTAVPSGIPDIHRSVLSGGETRLAQFGWLSNDCTLPVPDVRVVRKPAKGALRFETVATTVTASRSEIQKKCLGKPVQVMAMYYRSEPSAAGADKIVLDVDSKLGRVFHVTVFVDIKTGGAAANVQAGTTELHVSRSVLAGNETRLGAPNYLNADCSSGPIPAVRVVTAPKNGSYRTEEAEIAAERPSGNVRANCNGKPVKALAIYYKPNDGFTGGDEITIDVDFKSGTVHRTVYAITVR